MLGLALPWDGLGGTSRLLSHAGKNSKTGPGENESQFYCGRDKEAKTWVPGNKTRGGAAHCPSGGKSHRAPL